MVKVDDVDVPAGLVDEIDSITTDGTPGYQPEAFTREGMVD
jgi:hypothetical protein